MSEQYNITIPATAGGSAGVHVLNVRGSVFFCISTTGNFRVRQPAGGEYDIAAGRGFGSPAASQRGGFQSLTFYNDTGNAINATVHVGFAEFKDPQANVNNQNIAVSAKDPNTYTKATLVNPNATTTFNGLNGADQRKQIIVTNPGATSAGGGNAADVQLKDGNDVNAGRVPPGQAVTLITNGTIKVSNPLGSAEAVEVLETFYS